MRLAIDEGDEGDEGFADRNNVDQAGDAGLQSTLADRGSDLIASADRGLLGGKIFTGGHDLGGAQLVNFHRIAPVFQRASYQPPATM
jgi:hypothetical protein